MRDTVTEPCLWASDHGVDIEEPVLGDGMGAAKEWSWSANFSAVRGSLVFFFLLSFMYVSLVSLSCLEIGFYCRATNLPLAVP